MGTTTIINLYGELAREYVKRWAWERRGISPYDQFYFLGKQIREETQRFGNGARMKQAMLYGNVCKNVKFAKS